MEEQEFFAELEKYPVRDAPPSPLNDDAQPDNVGNKWRGENAGIARSFGLTQSRSCHTSIILRSSHFPLVLFFCPGRE